MKKGRLFGFIMAVLAANTSFAEDIPMLGIAEDGSPVEVLVPESTYKEKLTQAVISLQDSSLNALQSKNTASSGWMLRTAVVGLGVKIELGLGPIVKFGILPRFRLAFTNSKEPSVP